MLKPSKSGKKEPKAEDGIAAMNWGEPQEPLPVALAFLWHGIVQGERKLDLKKALDVIPRFATLSQQAKANNFKSDGMNEINKVQKRVVPMPAAFTAHPSLGACFHEG